MSEENKAAKTVAYMDGQPVEMGREPMQFTVAHMEGGEIVPDTPDFSEGAVKLDPEKLAAAIATVKDMVAALAPVWEQLAKTVRKITNAILRGYEWEQAIRWAAVYNPRLVRFYRHTKKKRIRKKYAKRILAWYREEVRGCCD